MSPYKYGGNTVKMGGSPKTCSPRQICYTLRRATSVARYQHVEVVLSSPDQMKGIRNARKHGYSYGETRRVERPTRPGQPMVSSVLN